MTWDLKIFRLRLFLGKFEGECKWKKIKRKNKRKEKMKKNKVKDDKLFLFVISNFFYLF